jgi:small subunit ribosomal protein S6e
MVKINISEKSGKTYKLESDANSLMGKSLHDKINGQDISPDLQGYEFEIMGASDKAGFTAIKEVEGIGLKKVLLSYEKGMKTRPKKEGKKKRSDKTPKGLRLRKTVRGKIISEMITQINLKILKQGNKSLEEIFPEQNKVVEKEVPKKEEPVVEEKEVLKKEEPVVEEKEEEIKEKKELSTPEKEPKGEVPKEGIEEAKE